MNPMSEAADELMLLARRTKTTPSDALPKQDNLRSLTRCGLKWR